MTSVAEHRRHLPTDGEAILNALPNPVLLVAPDGRIVDANIAAESFFEISTQFLRRQALKALGPVGRPPPAVVGPGRSRGGGCPGSIRAARAPRRSTNTRSISARPASAAIARSICTSPRSPNGP